MEAVEASPQEFLPQLSVIKDRTPEDLAKLAMSLAQKLEVLGPSARKTTEIDQAEEAYIRKILAQGGRVRLSRDETDKLFTASEVLLSKIAEPVYLAARWAQIGSLGGRIALGETAGSLHRQLLLHHQINPEANLLGHLNMQQMLFGPYPILGLLARELNQSPLLASWSPESWPNGASIGAYSLPGHGLNMDAYCYQALADGQGWYSAIFNGSGSSLAAQLLPQLMRESLPRTPEEMILRVMTPLDQALQQGATSGSLLSLTPTPEPNMYQIITGHVGRTAIYHLSAKTQNLRLVTPDESTASGILDSDGVPYPGQETAYYRKRQESVNFFGRENGAKISAGENAVSFEAAAGDALLIVSDGIPRNLTKPQINGALTFCMARRYSAESLAREPVRRARQIAEGGYTINPRAWITDTTAVAIILGQRGWP